VSVCTSNFIVIGLLDLDYHFPTHGENTEMQRVVFNTIIAPNWKVDQIIHDQWDNNIRFQNFFNRPAGRRSFEEFTAPQAFWILQDSTYLDVFLEEAASLLPSFYLFDTWSHVHTPLESAMSDMQWIFRQILWFSIGATIVILSLLITLYLRDRRHEIGIYLALGEKQSNIAMQILSESIPVALLGMTLALFLGNSLSSNLSHHMLQQSLTEEHVWRTGSTFIENSDWQHFSNLEFRGLGRELTAYELISMFEISLDGQTLVIFYLVGLLTITFSTLIPIAYAFTINPKKILMQSNIG